MNLMLSRYQTTCQVTRTAEPTIILGYYGTGKSYLASKCDNVVELVYIHSQPTLEQLLDAIGRYDIILVDPKWRQILIDNGYEFHIVLPDVTLRDEYMERFRQRRERRQGNGSPAFVRSMEQVWDRLLDELKKLPNLSLTILNKGQYLSDIIKKFE